MNACLVLSFLCVSKLIRVHRSAAPVNLNGDFEIKLMLSYPFTFKTPREESLHNP